jgi:serine/threonine protein kinase
VKVPKLVPGDQLAKHLTVLGVIDAHQGQSLCIVWNHEDWCPMACKVLRSARRAAHEAAILRELSHPNIVRSFGVVAPAFLLLEFLEGLPLDLLLHKKPEKRMTVSDAVRVGIHVGAALQHIHCRGFLHMDVKPANIMVTGSGRPILFDFECSRKQQDPRPPYVEGTDPYMAPEERAKQPVTPQVDIFGLGVTLYEMIAGSLPFRVRRRRAPALQPPEARRLRAKRPNLPKSLDNLVLACLSRNPKDRPSLVELMPELHRFISAGPSMWPKDFCPIIR